MISKGRRALSGGGRKVFGDIQISLSHHQCDNISLNASRHLVLDIVYIA